LKVDAAVDERLDPEWASRAAARYLSESRESLTAIARRKRPGVTEADVNPFVVTSYNYGVGGMSRALRQYGPDFVTVLERYRSRSFRVAVKNFYASFLAARHVALDGHAYFGSVAVQPPLSQQRVSLPRARSARGVAEHFGVPAEALEELNPALSSQVWRGGRLIPGGYELRLPVRADGWEGPLASLAELAAEGVELGGAEYRVQPGDTACGVARRHGVSCQELIQENRLGRRAVIRIGQLLTIPGGVIPAGADAAYSVRRGDTACGIARRHGVSCAALLSANGLGRRSTIHPGQTLAIPAGG
jgi:membrane-bound lytic murein transglycosylase D